MGKRELSFRKKKKTNKNKKKNKFNKGKADEGFLNEKSKYSDNVSIPKNLPYEAFITKLKGNKKYPKSLEYLSLFVSNKSEWKFNVINLYSLKLNLIYIKCIFNF